MSIPGDRFGAHLRETARGALIRARRALREEGEITALDARRRAPRSRGDLARSIGFREIRRPGEAGFTLTSSHPGALLQEYGGVVRPRTVRFLAIPLQGQREWPRQRGRHIVIRSGGDLLLFDKRPRDGGTPQYALRREVRVREQPYMRPAVRNARARLRRRLARDVVSSRGR